MQKITVTHDSDDLLQIEEWSFWFDDRTFHLVLDGYRLLKRETKRHKFNTYDAYDRIRKQKSSLAVHEVPLPANVASAAKQQFIDKLVVVREM
jgi:hypothetical protein